MEKVANFFKALGDSAEVAGYFPLWFKVVCLFSAIYLLLFGGLFIYFYAKSSALLKTSAALSSLEKKALTGDPSAMVELSFSSSPHAFDIIASVIRSNPKDETRQNAIIALSNINDPRKVEVLGGTLLAEKWLVAAACAQSLGRSGDPAAVPYLVRALELRIDWVVAQKSAEALGNFPPSEAVARALVAALNEGESSFEAEAAKQSLVKFGPYSVPFLIDNLSNSTSGQGLEQTIHALRLLGTADAPKVMQALTSFKAKVNTLEEISVGERSKLISEAERASQELERRHTGADGERPPNTGPQPDVTAGAVPRG